MQRKFRITVDGRPYTVTVEDVSDENSLIFPGPGSMTVPTTKTATPVHAAPPAEPSRAQHAPRAESGDVVATLGGIVVRISVSVGQSVSIDDEVVVIEAMKMNAPIVAHRAGTVKAIHVQDGKGVETGQVLVTIE
jgi:biotin carboxyl carrier protein